MKKRTARHPSKAPPKTPHSKPPPLELVEVDHPVFGKIKIHPEAVANRTHEAELLNNIKARSPELQQLLALAEDHWGMEDGVYRFYHQSFKVHSGLQPLTLRITEALQKLMPHRQLNEWYAQIVEEGTRETFHPEHNRNWLKHTRPIVEGFFHAYFMLKMVCKYGREL
jgi:hypothetical protein